MSKNIHACSAAAVKFPRTRGVETRPGDRAISFEIARSPGLCQNRSISGSGFPGSSSSGFTGEAGDRAISNEIARSPGRVSTPRVRGISPQQHCMHECFCSSRAAGSVTYWFSESILRVVFQPLLHLGLRGLGTSGFWLWGLWALGALVPFGASRGL